MLSKKNAICIVHTAHYTFYVGHACKALGCSRLQPCGPQWSKRVTGEEHPQPERALRRTLRGVVLPIALCFAALPRFRGSRFRRIRLLSKLLLVLLVSFSMCATDPSASHAYPQAKARLERFTLHRTTSVLSLLCHEFVSFAVHLPRRVFYTAGYSLLIAFIVLKSSLVVNMDQIRG